MMLTHKANKRNRNRDWNRDRNRNRNRDKDRDGDRRAMAINIYSQANTCSN